MKLVKYTSIILLLAFFTSGCSSVKETLTGAKKSNTDEFFVKKKTPLDLPPNFNEIQKNKREIKKNNCKKK